MTTPPGDPLAQLAAPPVFVVGAHRSGTTWAYELLAAHPRAAGVFESGLFSGDLGIARLFHPAHWYDDPEALERDRELFGSPFRLNQLLARDEALADVRELTSRWLARALGPDDRYLVEKTPQHVHTMAVIADLYPGCAFVHVIRDGRDVALSVEAAARSWPRGRVRSEDRTTAAGRWAAAIAGARRQTREHALRYTETRFEDLKRDTRGELARLFGFCGMPAEDAVVERIVAEQALAARRSGPDDRFRRRGEVGEWRAAFGLRDRLRFDRAAGAMLVELGYETDRRWWLRRGGRAAQPAGGGAEASVEPTTRAGAPTATE